MRDRWELGLGVLGVLVAAGSVVDPPAARGETARADPLAIEEIIVTARKREESLLSVPGSVSAFTGEDIKNQSISDLTDLGSKTPNVLMNAVSSAGTVSPGFVVRGISSQSAGPGFPPGIGVYMDGVFLGRDRAFNTVLNDIEAVEILRGPQGSLYGKNTVAGAINLRTMKPTNELEARIDLTYGTDELRQARGTLSLPIVEDRVLLRLSGISKSQDGFITNELTGHQHGQIDADGGRARLILKPTENLEFDLQADTFDQDDDLVLETAATILLPFPPYSTLPVPDPDDRSVGLDIPEFAKRELDGYSGRITYDMGGFELTSITAYREYESNFGDDSDGVRLDEFNTGREENFDHFMQELRVTSPSEDRLSWILGLYYENENLESIRPLRLGPDFPTLILGLPPVIGQETAVTQADIDSEAWAVFGSVNYDISDTLELGVGLRYTDEKKDVFYQQLPIEVVSGAIFAFVVPIPGVTDTYDDNEVSGDVTLSWEFAPSNSIYGRYARGYKAGGFQADTISPPGTAASLDFNAEVLDAWEVGYKGLLWNGRMSLQAAAFYYDFTDKQEQVHTGVSFVVSNAGETTNYGAEVEVMARLADGLDLQASLGVLAAEYDKFPNGGGPGINFDGNDLAGAPEFTGSVNLQYVRPFGNNLELFLRGEVDFRDGFYTDPANNPDIEVDSAVFANARVGLRRADQGWAFYVYGKNLNDENVLGGGVSTAFNTARTINRGREIGGELRFNF